MLYTAILASLIYATALVLLLFIFYTADELGLDPPQEEALREAVKILAGIILILYATTVISIYLQYNHDNK